MALSRFWLTIILVSVTYILASLFSGSSYSIDYVVNGKKDDPLVKKELYLSQLSVQLQDTLQKAKDHRVTFNDSLYILDNKIVRIAVGKQATDGILPTAKNTIFDLLLPLIAYLSFFCGILQLLIDSGASEKLAKLLSPVFVKVFPEVPKNHSFHFLYDFEFCSQLFGS